MRAHPLALAFLCVAGPAVAAGPDAAEPLPYGPEMPMKGVFETAFEHSSFNGCWLQMTEAAAGQYATLLSGAAPPDKYGRSRVEIEILGRKADRRYGLLGGYGHLGASPCQIEATKVISARALETDSVVAENRDAAPGG